MCSLHRYRRSPLTKMWVTGPAWARSTALEVESTLCELCGNGLSAMSSPGVGAYSTRDIWPFRRLLPGDRTNSGPLARAAYASHGLVCSPKWHEDP